MAIPQARFERAGEGTLRNDDTRMSCREPDVDVEALALRAQRSLYLRFVKPAVERTVVAILGVLLLPFMAVIAALLRRKLGPHVLITQERVGLHGQPFRMYKFRTMLPDRRASRRPVGVERRLCHKSADDPRHTSIGRTLRGTGLDELPQLWNIVKGEMSLVGPRPELVEIVEQYEPWQHVRHMVRPGLTGLWQVSGRKNGDMMHLHTELDIEFLKTASFSTDVGILWNTLHNTIRGRLRGA